MDHGDLVLDVRDAPARDPSLGHDARSPRTARRADVDAARAGALEWKADNYNHLLEQPTLFYAIAIVLALVGRGDGWDLGLAWSYVGLRVVQSLVQTTWKKIEVRFALFFLSSVVLISMTVRAAIAVL